MGPCLMHSSDAGSMYVRGRANEDAYLGSIPVLLQFLHIATGMSYGRNSLIN